MLPVARALLASVELDIVAAETVRAAQSALPFAVDLRYAPHGGVLLDALAKACSEGGTAQTQASPSVWQQLPGSHQQPP